MKILGIDTSCDDTSMAIVEDGKKILLNDIYSQYDIHKEFQGIVPELASRAHLIAIEELLEKYQKEFSYLDAIAVSHYPGLIGSLMIGVMAAKGLSYSLNIPLIGINHIEGHLYTPHLEDDISFPYIGLVCSGGHTLLYKVESFDHMILLGSTIDDAIGEAYDKVAKLLNLGYPGGPVIDKLAKIGDPHFLNLPRTFLRDKKDRYNFSYSGLKTAVYYALKKMDEKEILKHQNDIAASFQYSAISTLLDKVENALKDTNIKTLVFAGGVAANSLLREKTKEYETKGIKVYKASLKLCSDNGAMIAGRAYIDFQLGKKDGLDLVSFPRLSYLKKGKRI